MFKCISPCSDLLGKCEKVHDKTVHATLDVCRDFRAIKSDLFVNFYSYGLTANQN